MSTLLHQFRVTFSSRLLIRFFLIIFVWSVVEGMITFYMPLFVESQLSHMALVGLFLGINSFASLATDILFGFVSDLSDYRKFFYLGAISILAMVPLLLWGEGVWAVLALVVLWGAQFEMFLRFGSALFLAQNSPRGEYESLASSHFMIRHVGYFSGAILADYLRISSEVLVVAAIGILISINLGYMFIAFVKQPVIELAHRARNLSFLSELRVMRRHFKKVLPHIFLGFGVAGVEAIFLVFGPIEFSSLTGLGGLITGFGLFVYVLVPTLSVVLIRKLSAGYVVGVLGLLSFITASLYALGLDLWGIIGVTMLILVFNAMLMVINDATFLKMLSKIKQDDEEEVISINGLAPNLAYGAIAVAGGVIIEASGFYVAFTASVFILLLCVVGFVVSYRG